jgi:hypothetical protein
MKQLLIVGFALCLVHVASTANAQDITDSSKCAIHRKSSEGWDRYYLTGPDGDAICVYLPKKPEKFAGGKLRGGNTPVTADVYLAGGNDEIYTVIFMYDLPKKRKICPTTKRRKSFSERGGVRSNMTDRSGKKWAARLKFNMPSSTSSPSWGTKLVCNSSKSGRISVRLELSLSERKHICSSVCGHLIARNDVALLSSTGLKCA